MLPKDGFHQLYKANIPGPRRCSCWWWDIGARATRKADRGGKIGVKNSWCRWLEWLEPQICSRQHIVHVSAYGHWSANHSACFQQSLQKKVFALLLRHHLVNRSEFPKIHDEQIKHTSGIQTCEGFRSTMKKNMKICQKVDRQSKEILLSKFEKRENQENTIYAMKNIRCSAKRTWRVSDTVGKKKRRMSDTPGRKRWNMSDSPWRKDEESNEETWRKHEDCQIPREETLNNVKYLMKKKWRIKWRKNEDFQIPREEKMKNVRYLMKKKWRIKWRKNEDCQIPREEKMKNVRYLVKKKWRMSDTSWRKKWRIKWRQNEDCQIPREEKMKNVRYPVKKKWRMSDTSWRKNEENK